MTKSPPIHWPHEVLYLESLLRITNAIGFEGARLENAIRKLNDGQEKPNESDFLDPIQNIVIHAAGLSRFFWPIERKNSKKYKYNQLHLERAELLRKTFNVTDQSPLESRTVRNFIEHFDEKLDIFLTTDKAGTFYTSFVGFSNAKEIPYNHLYRAYFLDTQSFRVLGEEIQLKPLLLEIARIDALVEEFLRNGGRFPITANL